MRKLGRGCLMVIGGFVVLIIAIAVIAALVGGSSSGTSSKPITGKQGVPAHVADNLDVTLTGYALSKGNEVETPKSGNEYVITHWKFHNFRKDNTDVADTGFSVNSAGVITDAEFASALTKNELGSTGTALSPGATVRRDIVFQITKGRPAKIIYQPDSSDSSRKVTWTIRG
jgi:hypothetical protein